MVLLPQSHDSSCDVWDTKCSFLENRYCIHRQHLHYWDSVVFSYWRLMQPPLSRLSVFLYIQVTYSYILLICLLMMCQSSMKWFERHFNCHHSDWRYTLIYAHTTSCILPTCDLLRLTNIGYAEAGAFVESLQPYIFTVYFFVIFHLWRFLLHYIFLVCCWFLTVPMVVSITPHKLVCMTCMV